MKTQKEEIQEKEEKEEDESSSSSDDMVGPSMDLFKKPKSEENE